MKRLLCLFAFLGLLMVSKAQLTLDYCFERAELNYPLIQKFDVINRTSAIELSDINKGWLPLVGVSAQVTGQNIVPVFPAILENMLEQMGQQLRGMGKIQYKAGVDLSQTIWDGGASKAARDVERARLTENKAAVTVGLYAVRERVLNLFFAILLIEQQIDLTQNTLDVLQANLGIVNSMVRNGVAMRSDADMVEAQLLTVRQQIIAAQSSLAGYRAMLGIFIGEDTDGRTLIAPAETLVDDVNSARPELELFDAQLRLNSSRQQSIRASVLPRVGFFAQAFYGYPGFNYFESMMNRKLSFNILAGLKVSWNMDALYTRKNAVHRLGAAAQGIRADRETFLFNSNLNVTAQKSEIEGLRQSMKDDARIVELRTNVRRAAESQLRNGIIDATALLGKITDENNARLTESLHRTQLLNHIYKLKYLLNQ